MKLAVIGKDVSASQSPIIHNFIAARMNNSLSYERISISPDRFEEEINKYLLELDGFNVTIPYKLSVIPHLKALKGDAEIMGAVNTVTTHDLCGYNTDGLGFTMMLQNNRLDVNGKSVLVLGLGGAGKSVAVKLLNQGAKVRVFSRNYANVLRFTNRFAQIEPLESPDKTHNFMVVNATGVGMSETENQSPIGEEILNNCDVAVDLIYSPENSKFLQIAQSLGKKTVNGKGMLFYQAYFAQCIYFDLAPNAVQAEELFKEYMKETRK